MKCLQISNDFSGSKVHKNLYSHLDDLEIEQIIFNPIKQNTIVGTNEINFKTANSQVIYSKKLKIYHRVLFRKKINYLFSDLESKYNLNDIDLVHATTLFSDGAIALKIFKKYKKPYIVAVRGTDASLFLRYRKDLLLLLKDILFNASKIIFPSDAMKNKFFANSFIKSIQNKLTCNILVISNGIEDFWLSKISPMKTTFPNKILYIGKFNFNKNTLNLIQAIIQLRNEFPEIQLDLVGNGGENEKQIIKLSQEHKDFINYHGAIHNKEDLQKIYLSNHIFAMASYSETFGLVYLEALSQGLPILCSENEGIDGTFDIKIGEFVDPKSINSISTGLSTIMTNYNSYQLNKINFSTFNWKEIARTYLEIYSTIVRK